MLKLVNSRESESGSKTNVLEHSIAVDSQPGVRLIPRRRLTMSGDIVVRHNGWTGS